MSLMSLVGQINMNGFSNVIMASLVSFDSSKRENSSTCSFGFGSRALYSSRLEFVSTPIKILSHRILGDISVSSMPLDNLPVRLKSIEPIINRVVEQYPFLTKIEIIRIVKAFWETMREQLVLGNTITMHTFFSSAHLIRFNRFRLGKLVKVVKIKNNTPRIISRGRFRAL